MKKISIFIFLTLFLAAPTLFAQTHRLKKKQKRGHHRTTQRVKKVKKVKHVKKVKQVKRVKHANSRVRHQTHSRRKVVRHRTSHHRSHPQRRVVTRVHHNHHPRRVRVVHSVHYEGCGHHYDWESAEAFADDFLMPGLNCPYRTREVSSGNAQWCQTRRGVRHGPYKRWNRYGSLMVSGHYYYDEKDGDWTQYHANGYVHREYEYDHGSRCGTWSSWDREGIVISVILQ